LYRLLILAALVLSLTPDLASTSEAQTFTNVTVIVSCRTNPETVSVANLTNAPITVVGVTSLYAPLGAEPFVVNFRLQPGLAVTFSSGPAAVEGVQGTLTRQEIFTDNDPREGVSVIVDGPSGRLNLPGVLCSAVSGTFNIGPSAAGAPVQPTATRPPAAAPPPATTSIPPPAAATGATITPPSTGDAGLRH
jgi:hypothetical protein